MVTVLDLELLDELLETCEDHRDVSEKRSLTCGLTSRSFSSASVSFQALAEQADLAPLVAPGELPAEREQWPSTTVGRPAAAPSRSAQVSETTVILTSTLTPLWHHFTRLDTLNRCQRWYS